MINTTSKTIMNETIQWRRMKMLLSFMRDSDGVIRGLHIAYCDITALPRTMEATTTDMEVKPWWIFWRPAKVTNKVLGFEVEGAVLQSVNFRRVPKRTTVEEVAGPKVKGPKVKKWGNQTLKNGKDK